MPGGRWLAGKIPHRLVRVVEVSSAQKRQSDGIEISGRDDAPTGPRRFVSGCRLGLCRRINAHAWIAAFHWTVTDGAYGDNAGNGGEAGEQIVEELFADSLIPIRLGHADREHEAVLSLKPGVYVQQIGQAADKQSGANQQESGKRDFTRHQ